MKFGVNCGNFSFSAAHCIFEYENMEPKTFNAGFYDSIRAGTFVQVLLRSVTVLGWAA